MKFLLAPLASRQLLRLAQELKQWHHQGYLPNF